MDDADHLAALLHPLLRAVETLTLVARHLHPPRFSSLMSSIGTPDQELRVAQASAVEWPKPLSGVRDAIDGASEATLSAYAGLREALENDGDVRGVYRALRFLPKALEALYPLGGILPVVNRFFLDPAARSDSALEARLLNAPADDNTGVMRFAADSGERGGFWLYVRNITRTIAPGRW